MLYLPSPHAPRILDDNHQEFLGVIYHKNNCGYYIGKNRLLHREVWKFFNGEIPKGYHIHHVSQDKDCNDITNLVIMTDSEHHKLHWLSESKIEVVCPVCGKKFLTWGKKPKTFCSDHCRFKSKYTPAQRVKRICQWCGKEFETGAKRPADFCSPRCNHLAWLAQPTEAVCAVCGKPISFPRGKPKKTCSKECERILIKRSRAKNTELIEKHCLCCGNIFHTSANGSRFCSRVCRARYQHFHSREIRKCVICGKEFSARKSTKTRCCSRQCASQLNAVPAEIVNKIRAEYIFGSHEFGSRALAKKYGISATTVLDVIKKSTHQGRQIIDVKGKAEFD